MFSFWYLFLLLLFSPQMVFAAVTFTGDVDADFINQNCFEDAGGSEILTPSGNTSGFDIDKVCFYYDGLTGNMLIGVTSFDDTIFGDVDGDGDPASSVTGLADFADLDDAEHIVLSFDVDGDSLVDGVDEDTMDFLVGVSSDTSLDDLGVFRVDSSYNPFLAAAGFGASLSDQSAAILFASPSSFAPDLEFTLTDFLDISVEGLEIENQVVIMVVAGSTAVESIGLDYLPSAGVSQAHNIFDYDDDGLEDWEELDVYGTDGTDSDSDDDDLPDGTEVDGANPTDPLDADSDDDACSDGTEDFNLDGDHDAPDGESDPNIADTDGDGIDDCTELTQGSDPNDASDPDSAESGDDDLSGQESSLGYNQVQGGGCDLTYRSHNFVQSHSYLYTAFIMSASLIFFLKTRQKIIPNDSKIV